MDQAQNSDNPSPSLNMHRNFMTEFNPQSDVIPCWQDTIEEESNEDEETFSPYKIDRVKASLIQNSIEKAVRNHTRYRSLAMHSKGENIKIFPPKSGLSKH